MLSSDEPLSSASTSFTAAVTRMSCHGGVTGTVLRPTIEEDDATVIVTFAVEAATPGIYACPSNDFVPVVVDLSEPLGERPLIDGGCRVTDVAQTAWCADELGALDVLNSRAGVPAGLSEVLGMNTFDTPLASKINSKMRTPRP